MSLDPVVEDDVQQRKVMENHVVTLMLDGKTNPKNVMEISGCMYEVGTKDYNRLYHQAYRKRRILEKAQNTKYPPSLFNNNIYIYTDINVLLCIKKQALNTHTHTHTRTKTKGNNTITYGLSLLFSENIGFSLIMLFIISYFWINP